MGIQLYDNIIIDVYNQYYRIFNRNENIVEIGDTKAPIEAIVNFFLLTDGYIKKYGTQSCRVYYLFDNAKTTVLKNRKELDPQYKKSRQIQSEEFYRGIDLIELILKFYRENSCIYRKQGVEADDFVIPLINEFIQEHNKVLMISTDIDWCRALMSDEENDIIINQYTKNNEILTVKSFKEKYGFKPTETNIIFWKSIYGDDSDCILPTLPNYPHQYFLDTIKRYNHISQFISDSLNGNIKYLDSGWKIKIRQNSERMMLNWNLISGVDISINDLENWKVECSFKPNKLLIIYNTLNVIGRFDKRIKNENRGSDLLSMLDGEIMERA